MSSARTHMCSLWLTIILHDSWNYVERNKACFLVEDYGVGIPEVELEQVMQPFYKVNESSKQGNGLGLAISHEIAQLLGGQIHLENRRSGGLCFRYTQAAKLQT